MIGSAALLVTESENAVLARKGEIDPICGPRRRRSRARSPLRSLSMEWRTTVRPRPVPFASLVETKGSKTAAKRSSDPWPVSRTVRTAYGPGVTRPPTSCPTYVFVGELYEDVSSAADGVPGVHDEVQNDPTQRVLVSVDGQGVVMEAQDHGDRLGMSRRSISPSRRPRG